MYFRQIAPICTQQYFENIVYNVYEEACILAGYNNLLLDQLHSNQEKRKMLLNKIKRLYKASEDSDLGTRSSSDAFEICESKFNRLTISRDRTRTNLFNVRKRMLDVCASCNPPLLLVQRDT